MSKPFSSPQSSVRKSVYSWRYADEVIENFAMKYSRVLIFVSKKLHMDQGDFKDSLKKLFMYNNLRWNIVREVLKRIDKRDMYADLDRYNGEDFRIYLTSVRVDVEDNWLDDTISLKNPLTGERF